MDFFYIDYDAPEEDHTIVLSGSYSGVLGTFFGLYVDAYTDLQSGETRQDFFVVVVVVVVVDADVDADVVGDDDAVVAGVSVSAVPVVAGFVVCY